MTIQFNVRESEHWIALADPSPDKGSHPRQQFGDREGFRKVIVCAGVESLDALLHQAARRQHQDGHVHLCFANLAADLNTAQPGETYVEKHAVVRRRRHHFESPFTAFRNVYSVRVFAQSS